MARGVGALNVSVNADTAKANRNLGSFRSELNMLPGSAKSASSGLAGLRVSLGSVAAVGVGLLAAAVRNAAQEVDELAKSANKIGIATEKLAGLRLAADESGVGISQLENGLARMTLSLNTLPDGSNPLAPIGVSARELRGLAPEEQLRVIADGMLNTASASDRMAASAALFGRRNGLEMINLLSKGSATLDEAQAAAERMGLAIDAVEAAKIEAANDAMGRIGKSAQGAAMEIASFTAGFLELSANAIAGEKGLLTGLNHILGVTTPMNEHLKQNLEWAQKQKALEQRAKDRAAAEQKITEQYEKQMMLLKEKLAFERDPAKAQFEKDEAQFGAVRAGDLQHIRDLHEAELLRKEAAEAKIREAAEAERQKEQKAREAERKHQENLKRDAEELGRLRERVENFGKSQMEIDRERVLRELDDPKQKAEARGLFDKLERLERDQGRIENMKKDRDTLERRRDPNMLDARTAEGWAQLRSNANPQLQKMDQQIKLLEEANRLAREGKKEEVFDF